MKSLYLRSPGLLFSLAFQRLMVFAIPFSPAIFPAHWKLIDYFSSSVNDHYNFDLCFLICQGKKWSQIYWFLLLNMRKLVPSYLYLPSLCFFYFLIFLRSRLSVQVHYDYITILLHCIVLSFLIYFSNWEMYYI